MTGVTNAFRVPSRVEWRQKAKTAEQSEREVKKSKESDFL